MAKKTKERFAFFAMMAIFLVLISGCSTLESPQGNPSPTTVPTSSSIGGGAPTTVETTTTTIMTTTSRQTTTSISAPAIEWAADAGARVYDGSVPYAYRLADGRVRLYYCKGNYGIFSVISSDGMSFAEEAGTRLSPNPSSSFEKMVCDPSIVALGDGRVRMYYKGSDGVNGGPGVAVHKVFSAVSSDGLTFAREGLRIDSQTSGDGGWASVPEAIQLPDGRVRIYYVTGDPAVVNGIGSAISPDGLNFTKEPGARVLKFVDPAVVLLNDGRYLLAVANPGANKDVPAGIYTFTSEDGLNFTGMQTVLQERMVYDPSIIRTDNSTFRIFFGKQADSRPSAQVAMSVGSATGHLK